MAKDKDKDDNQSVPGSGAQPASQKHVATGGRDSKATADAKRGANEGQKPSA